MNKPGNNKNRLTLVVIVALFVSPVLTAIYLNSQWSDWSPPETRNYGQLVQPVVSLGGTRVQALQGELQRFANSGKWVMLHLDEHCGPGCRDTLVAMRQVHLASGFDSGKVAEALVLSKRSDAEDLARLAVDFPLLSILLDTGQLQALLDHRIDAPSAIYLVDPLGNVMMRYPPGFDPSGLKKDLARLLRYNKTGTTGASSP